MNKLHTIDLEAAKAFFEGGGQNLLFYWLKNPKETLTLSVFRTEYGDFLVRAAGVVLYNGKSLDEAVKAYNEA